jgi:dUTP pyrophosphatase
MMKLPLKVKTLGNYRGELPAYQTPLASGFDVRAMLDGAMLLQPGERAMIPTGLSFEIPSGYEIQARPRSGWAAKQGVTVLNTPGTIDADYRGEVKIIVINLGREAVEIKDQDRIAQLVLAPVLQAEFLLVSEITDSQRGSGGFGSTGISSRSRD